MGNTMKFIMRMTKKTKGDKVCFKENMNRIGRVYLPLQFTKKMNIDNEIILQLAPNKSFFRSGGYVAKFVYEKTPKKKLRFIEDITEEGEIGYIYISPLILEKMGVQDEIAVRVVPPSDIGDAAYAR